MLRLQKITLIIGLMWLAKNGPDLKKLAQNKSNQRKWRRKKKTLAQTLMSGLDYSPKTCYQYIFWHCLGAVLRFSMKNCTKSRKPELKTAKISTKSSAIGWLVAVKPQSAVLVISRCRFSLYFLWVELVLVKKH